MMRAVWSEDPVTFKSRYILAPIKEMAVTLNASQSASTLILGSSEPALGQAIRIGDGWHSSGLSADEAAPMVWRLRATRPEADFTISMRVRWNDQNRGGLRALLDYGTQS
jgi:alkanesulfonate monooxygenase SsuD/methylene tetrahydromethanopterin reductase-like flavin-dependent oxidoreductase (luciferase family)